MAAQVGEAIIRLTFDGKDVKAQLTNMENQIEKSGGNGGKKWATKWTVAAGNLIAKGVSKIAGAISSNLDSAIGRMDTLSNFPQVMQSLGYSAEESTQATEMLSDSLDGLPTSLDEMVSNVQMLSASMGNLASGEVNATKVGLAFNNMMLAGGQGTEAANRAFVQFNQMLAKGKVDMQSWNSIVQAAPGQMTQLSKSLLGANASQQDLYAAMQNGTVTFDQFNSALVKLNEQGGESFESFADQAVAATGGMATRIQNIHTSLTKVITAALEGNNEAVAKYSDQLVNRIQDTVPQLITGVTTAFQALANKLPDIITNLLPAVLAGVQSLITSFIAMVPQLLQSLNTAWPMIVTALTQLIGQISDLLSSPEFITTILDGALQLFTGILDAIPEILTQLLAALPQILETIISWLLDPNTITKLMEAAVKLFMGLVLAVPQILGSLIAAFGTLVGNLWNNITKIFGEFAGKFGEFIGGIFKGAINGVLSFIENFINAPIRLINGFIGLINSAFGWIGVNIGKIDLIKLPRLAEGGVADSATAAVFGEAGTEVVLPLEQNTDNWSGLLAHALADEMETEGIATGNPIEVYMTNEINNEMDANDIGRLMMQSIRRAA